MLESALKDRRSVKDGSEKCWAGRFAEVKLLTGQAYWLRAQRVQLTVTPSAVIFETVVREDSQSSIHPPEAQ